MMTTDSSNFRNPNHYCLKVTNDGVETLDHEFSTKASKATIASVEVMLSRLSLTVSDANAWRIHLKRDLVSKFIE